MARYLLIAGFAVLSASCAVHAEPQLTEGQFSSVLRTVRPGPTEDAFALIPWQTNLWDARKKAAGEGKPILLWEMDGHPLGCG